MTAGSACVVDPPPGCELLGVLVGVVLVGVVLVGGVLVEAVCTGVASGAAEGGGVEVGALGCWLDAVVEGETATTIGATAALCCTGLTAEPTRTPNASNAITATPATDGDSIARPAGESSSCESLAAGACTGAIPISSAIALGSGPRRAPHSTQ